MHFVESAQEGKIEFMQEVLNVEHLLHHRHDQREGHSLPPIPPTLGAQLQLHAVIPLLLKRNRCVVYPLCYR